MNCRYIYLYAILANCIYKCIIIYSPLQGLIQKRGIDKMSNKKSITICTAFITVKGRRIYARDVGKKAFCFEVTPEQNKAYHEKKKQKIKK